ncbi:PDZ domain-containing protein, partial [Planctomycetota bacterium]
LDFRDLPALGKFMKGKKPGQTVVLAAEREGWHRKFKVKLGVKAGTGGEHAQPQRVEKKPVKKPKPEPKVVQRRGFLGVYLADDEQGVGIRSVLPGSPAEEAGLKAGDHVSAVAGNRVKSLESFTASMRQYSAGDQVKLSVLRGDDKLEVTAKLGERPVRIPSPESLEEKPQPTPEKKQPEKKQPETKRGYLGISVAEEDGLTIIQIVEGSPAAKSGLAVGQRLVKIDGQKVTTIAELAGHLKDRLAGDKVELTLAGAGGKESTVTVTLAPRD